MRLKKLVAGFMIMTALTLGSTLAVLAADGTWQQDEKGWWFQNTDGSFPKETWVEDGGSWYRVGEDGYMMKGWIQVGEAWYYLDSSGVMAADTTMNIDGVDYVFDASGVWSKQPDPEPAPAPDPVPAAEEVRTPSSGVWDGETFKNAWAGYQMTFPEDFHDMDPYYHGGNTIIDFRKESADGMINIQVVYENINDLGGGFTPETYQEALKQELIATGLYIDGGTGTANVGGKDFIKLSMIAMELLNQDIYCRQIDNYIMTIIVSYTPGHVNVAKDLIGRFQG